MPRRVKQHFGIPTHRLSATQTTIYDFNANGTYPIEKIKLRCQIRDLKFEVTCYVIDADTLYNLLLGRPWIHRNFIVPSTLHQVMKYVSEDEKLRTLIAKRHPFKGVQNYFIDSLLYQDSLENDESPYPKEHDFGNEADTEPEEEECLWQINPLVMSIDKLDFDTTANVEGEWFINENLDLAYFFEFASNSVPSDTSTDVDSDPWSSMNALTSLRASIKSCLTVRKKIRDVHFLKYQPSRKIKGQLSCPASQNT